jgi:hypothetical protein
MLGRLVLDEGRLEYDPASNKLFMAGAGELPDATRVELDQRDGARLLMRASRMPAASLERRDANAATAIVFTPDKGDLVSLRVEEEQGTYLRKLELPAQVALTLRSNDGSIATVPLGTLRTRSNAGNDFAKPFDQPIRQVGR